MLDFFYSQDTRNVALQLLLHFPSLPFVSWLFSPDVSSLHPFLLPSLVSEKSPGISRGGRSLEEKDGDGGKKGGRKDILFLSSPHPPQCRPLFPKGIPLPRPPPKKKKSTEAATKQGFPCAEPSSFSPSFGLKNVVGSSSKLSVHV